MGTTMEKEGCDDELPGRSYLGKIYLNHRGGSPLFPYWGKETPKLAEENPDASWLIMNGNRVQIKRRQFEKVIDSLDVI